MRIFLCVTGCAVNGSAFKLPILMAGKAVDAGMLPLQRKPRAGSMVKGRRLPGGGRVTQPAFGPILARVKIIGCMAGDTLRWRALIGTCRVAGRALRFQVPANQLEFGVGAVVETGRFPAFWFVTGCAVGQPTFVRIIRRMAVLAV